MKNILKIFSPLTLLQFVKNGLTTCFKQLLLAGILFSFLFIYLQQTHAFFSLKPLKGYFIPKIYTPITLNSWFSGEYQKTTDVYLNDEFGFRTTFLRINNQIKLSFFKKANVEDVVVGKEDYLYQIGYIDTYYGKFFMGENAINDTINKIKLLQDTLKTFGKELLIVLAPSKARVYPEYIPDYMRKEPTTNTNYNYFTAGFKKAGVNFIDFNAIFSQKKSTSEYLLFPQLGVHWSRLEAIYAADTIIGQLAWQSQTNLPRIKILKTQLKDTLEAPDNDVIEGMNVLFYPKFKKMLYPIIDIETKNRVKKNLIVVSDSYWWDIYLREIPKQVFENNEFWYYNNEIYGTNYLGKSEQKKIDIKRHLLYTDYIVLLCTESNFSRLGFGFLGSAIAALRTPIEPTGAEINDVIEIIKSDKSWYTNVVKKASDRKLSIDTQLILDARWYFQRRGPVRQEFSLAEIKAYIKTDAIWYKDVIKKAEDRKTSIDSMITEDALWYEATALKPKGKIKLTLPNVKNMIRHNTVWMEQIKDKATKREISVDSMMTLDAVWYIEHQ